MQRQSAKRRGILSWTWAVLMCALISASLIPPQRGVAIAASKPITLNVLAGPNRSEFGVVEAIASRWNALHADIKVKVDMVPEGSVAEQVFITRVIGGSGPDIYTAMPSGPMVQFSKDKSLVALDELSDFWTAMEKRTTAGIAKQFVLKDKHIYMVPWQAGVLMIEYNHELLEQMGYEKFPKTYSQFFDLSRRLKAKKIAGMDIWLNEAWDARIADFYMFYLAASGGKSLTRNGRAAFNNAVGEKVLQFFVDLDRFGFRPETPVSGDGFVEGKIMTQRWGQDALEYFNDKAKFDWRAAPVLVPDDYNGPEPPFTYFNLKSLVVPTTTKYKNEAWQFIKFMIDEAGDRTLLVSGRFPIREDLGRNQAFASWFKANPRALPFAHNLKNVRSLDLVPNIEQIFAALSEEFVAAVMGMKSVQTALSTATERINKLLF